MDLTYIIFEEEKNNDARVQVKLERESYQETADTCIT